MTVATGSAVATAPFGVIRIAWAPLADGVPRRDTASLLARAMLVEVGAGDVELSRRCAHCGGVHGPVRTTPATWRVSITYAGDWAIVAIAPAAAARSIGIDAECWDDPRREAAGWRGLLADGAHGALAWTRVEAALKADERALRVAPALVRVREQDAGWIATLPGAAETIRGIDVDGPDGVAVSVAVREVAAAASRPATQ